MKNLELLAPAGSQESLKAAILAGADAVYLGGQFFGARKSASNFDDAALAEAVKYAHQRKVAVYVTVNTLIKESEFLKALDFIDFLYGIDVDALIFQDMGLLMAVKEKYPDLECHLSTQMTLHNTDDVLWAKQIGASRVVLARELSIKEASDIQKATEMPLEIFVHGALCIAYSGNCLMSSYIGGRSGNRGGCAQPCRKPYELIQRDTGEKVHSSEGVYLMSPKDTMGIDYISQFKTLSPVSLKLEGRMKGPDYVYTVVDAYRKAIDYDRPTTEIDLMRRVFNREYGPAYLMGKQYEAMMNVKLPSNAGYEVGAVLAYKEGLLTLQLTETLNKGDEVQFRFRDKTVGARADQIFKGNEKVAQANAGDVVNIPFKHKVPVKGKIYKTFDKQYIDDTTLKSQSYAACHKVQMHFEAKMSSAPMLTIRLKDHVLTVSSNVFTEKAMKVPLTKARVSDQLSKLGGTPFELDAIEIEMDLDLAFPISEINRMRREGVERLLETLENWHHRLKPIKQWALPSVEESPSPVTFYLYFESLSQLQAALPYVQAQRLVLKNIDEYMANEAYCTQNQIIPYVPKIIRDDELEPIRTWVTGYVATQKPICLTHYGQLTWLERTENTEWLAEETLQVFNKKTYAYFKSLGAKNVMASSELSITEASEISKNLGLWVYGKLPLMNSEYCPIGKVTIGGHNCGACEKNAYGLRDEKGALYPIVCNRKNCRVTILSNHSIYYLDHVQALIQKGHRLFKIDFTGAESDEIIQICKANFPSFDTSKHTRGRLKQGIE